MTSRQHLRNEFNFWNVHGIMNTSGVKPKGLHVNSARDPKYTCSHHSMTIPKIEFIAYIKILL